ncbi:MAG: hypothetical protein WC067_05775 [Candidatus Methanomethylophilaceae archaeon]|jgi:hypothetical protein
MNRIMGIPSRGRRPYRAMGTTAADTVVDREPIPFSVYLGDIAVPWNVGMSLWRIKSARKMRIVNATIAVDELVSPSGAPILIEAWKNGRYSGVVELVSGANEFPSFELNQLDEVELRILVKGEHASDTEAIGLWILYCVE